MERQIVVVVAAAAARQRTLTVGGSITVRLVYSLTSVKLTNEGGIILFVFSEAV